MGWKVKSVCKQMQDIDKKHANQHKPFKAFAISVLIVIASSIS